ncbi:MAG TPA: hypothetical protein VFF06_02315 [Polyangia bacterium]|nr:hypothetical protein [Polyangia bacterium]
MKRVVSALIVNFALVRAAFAATPYEDWAVKYAAAAKALAAIVAHTPGGAKAFSKWAAKSPEDTKKVGEYMKEHADAPFDAAATKLKNFALLNSLVEAGLFSESFEKWVHHNADAALALFSDVEAMKVALTPPAGAKGSLFGALSDAAPPGRESDEMFGKYQAIARKELPARGGLDGKFGAQYHDLVVTEYADQPGCEVLKTYLYGADWEVTADALNDRLPRHRNIRGITIIRKDKTKCMVFFDSLGQDWTSRDLAGHDHYDAPLKYSMDDRGRYKIDCAAAK